MTKPMDIEDFLNLPHVFEDREPFKHDISWCTRVVRDKEGKLWMGDYMHSYDNGIDCYDQDLSNFGVTEVEAREKTVVECVPVK